MYDSTEVGKHDNLLQMGVPLNIAVEGRGWELKLKYSKQNKTKTSVQCKASINKTN